MSKINKRISKIPAKISPPTVEKLTYEIKHSKTGRPTVITEEALTKLQVAFSIGCNNKEACSFAEISTKVYYDWLQRNPDFRDLIQQLEDKLTLKARQTIVNNLDKPEVAKWWLERKCKSEFSLRTEHTGKDGRPINQGFSLTELFDEAEKFRNQGKGKASKV